MNTEIVKNGRQDLELYIHIPFCARKCNYCDFLSAPADKTVQNEYMKALLTEVEGRSEEVKGYRVISVYIGGGTPSVVDPDWIVQLLEKIRKCYDLQEVAEISIEVNPGSATRRQLEMYRSAGINRLSIGLQSAVEQELKELGRIHTFEQFLDTYYTARQIGFSNINVDLMSALPGQTIDSWQYTLKTVLQLSPKPEHISAYSLIIEEGTVLYQSQEEGMLVLPDEDSDRQMYALTESLLAQSGYQRYEISNYALAGYECRHNLGYWRRTQYLGLGLGASSLLKECRFQNNYKLQEYMQEPLGLWQNRKKLTIEEQMEEFMFLGLRMMEGISKQDFYRTFGIEIGTVYEGVLRKNIVAGLIRESNFRYCLTPRGIDVSNYVLAQFLLD